MTRLETVAAVVTALLLGGCSSPPQEQAQPLSAPTGSATTVQPSAGDDPPANIPFLEVPPAPPLLHGGSQTPEPFVYRPAPTAPSGTFGLPTNPGPVTGYGPGGLAKPPGAPSNPPFHY
jgi:hypothetical protein